MTIIRYTGIYNADGGVWSETRYVIGHLLGITACSLWCSLIMTMAASQRYSATASWMPWAARLPNSRPHSLRLRSPVDFRALQASNRDTP